MPASILPTYSRPSVRVTIGALALPITPVPGSTPCPEIDRIFTAYPDWHSLVVRRADGSYDLLDRLAYEYKMNATYGYGRMLYMRTAIEQMIAPGSTLTLHATTAVQDAYEAVMARDAQTRFQDVIVLGGDHGVATLRVAELLDEIARHNASDALHDHLTGLANRALMTEWLDHALGRIEPPNKWTVALLFLDIDRFKVVNDSIGHEAGDELLCQFADRLLGCIRAVDAAARLGGDEFAILVDQVMDSEQAASVARRIHEVLRTPMHIGGRELVISSSIGIALAQRGDDVSSLLRKADIAMYQAKHEGGGRFQFFHGDQGVAAQARLDLEVWLRRAVSEHRLQVRYQPIVHLADDRVIGFEALVRGMHPERGLLSPGEFLPVAEETGLLRLIDRDVFIQACEELRRWNEQTPSARSLSMSINVSADRLESRDLPQEIASAIEMTGVDPRRIQIEITESSMVRNMSHAVRTLESIRSMGVRVAVDDFGTGYASLAHLSKLPLDVLKIDASFISGLAGSRHDQAIVRLVMALAGAMEVTAIAEGVETPRQAELLREVGCRFGQGFLFAEPLEAAEAALLVSGGARIITPTVIAPDAA